MPTVPRVAAASMSSAESSSVAISRAMAPPGVIQVASVLKTSARTNSTERVSTTSLDSLPPIEISNCSASSRLAHLARSFRNYAAARLSPSAPGFRPITGQFNAHPGLRLSRSAGRIRSGADPTAHAPLRGRAAVKPLGNDRASKFIATPTGCPLEGKVHSRTPPWPDAQAILVACSSYLKPSLTGGDEPIRTGRPFERLRLFLVVQFNEFQERLINPPDGIADSAPEPASIKRTLVC